MSKIIETDLMIAGSGIAGITTAYQAVKHNLSVSIFDPNGIEYAASSLPLGMLNYSAGRKAKPIWDVFNCYDSVRVFLSDIEPYKRTDFMAENGVLRPAMSQKIAHDFKQSTVSYNLGQDWVQWLEEDEIKLRFKYPYFCEYGGLWLPKAFSFHGYELLFSARQWLLNRGVHLFDCDYEYDYKNGKHQFTTGDTTVIADYLVCCSSHHSLPFIDISELNLHVVKGQLLEIKPIKPIAFNFSVSGLGYLTQLNEKYCFGSTYEHHFDDLASTDEAKERLTQKLSTLLDEKDLFAVISQWSDARVTTRNRLPIIGQIDFTRNIWVNTGYGSKGMAYASKVSTLLIEQIVNGAPIPKELSTSRSLT